MLAAAFVQVSAFLDAGDGLLAGSGSGSAAGRSGAVGGIAGFDGAAGGSPTGVSAALARAAAGGFGAAESADALSGLLAGDASLLALALPVPQSGELQVCILNGYMVLCCVL